MKKHTLFLISSAAKKVVFLFQKYLSLINLHIVVFFIIYSQAISGRVLLHRRGYRWKFSGCRCASEKLYRLFRPFHRSYSNELAFIIPQLVIILKQIRHSNSSLLTVNFDKQRIFMFVRCFAPRTSRLWNLLYYKNYISIKTKYIVKNDVSLSNIF